MQVDVIDSADGMLRIRDNWNAVYDADPTAQLFLSWDWLAGWFAQLQGPWLVLAARDERAPASGFQAFLPLRLETRVGEGGVYRSELKMAGNHVADYTGLISTPDAEARAIAAFARTIRQMRWARLQLDNFASGRRRLDLLLAHFGKGCFVPTQVDRVGKVDGIDIDACPYIDLPGDWEAYLATLSANTRQKIRRMLRLTEGGEGGLRITHASPRTIERDIDVLLGFWDIKWRPRKGPLTDGLVRSNRGMLLDSFGRGLLFLPVLWSGERPVAALAILNDPRKRSYLFYMTGRDESFDGPPPGVILHGHSIRHAIANGIARYDFLRGNERYKYSFGVKEARISCVMITPREVGEFDSRIDRRAVPEVLKLATALHRAGKLAEAERGYRLILEVAPDEPESLHRLGQLLMSRQRPADAVQIFRRLCKVRPAASKAWLCLAQACEGSGRPGEAADAYGELVVLSPGVQEFVDGRDRMMREVKASTARGRASANPAGLPAGAQPAPSS